MEADFIVTAVSMVAGGASLLAALGAYWSSRRSPDSGPAAKGGTARTRGGAKSSIRIQSSIGGKEVSIEVSNLADAAKVIELLEKEVRDTPPAAAQTDLKGQPPQAENDSD